MSKEREEIKQYEDVIKKIKDVISVKINTSPDGSISEIHVLANSNRSPKQIVRDIESALIACFGSNIDHKKISVAQLGEESGNKYLLRLKVNGIEVKKSGITYEVMVSLLGPENNIYEGRALGGGSLNNLMKLSAQATLEAVHKFLNREYVFNLEEVLSYKISDKEAVAVLVSSSVNGHEEYFLGSSLLKQDKPECTARATLDAINRRLTVITSENCE
ncbi:MAG: hypothetical protein ACPLRZ_03175 [Thermovenabulum sp.]|uniref:hypothetical protein n=1 Tax=Thermovenabulum sp. TaxID=3100335 RepID=UPI003C7E8C83